MYNLRSWRVYIFLTTSTLFIFPIQNLLLKVHIFFNFCRNIPSQCLKNTEKVAFNVASEGYILRGQKLIKNDKNGPFWPVFENLKLGVK